MSHCDGAPRLRAQTAGHPDALFFSGYFSRCPPAGVVAALLPMPRASAAIPTAAIKRKRISRARYRPPLPVIFIEKVLPFARRETVRVSFASVDKTLSRKPLVFSQNGSR